VIRAKGGFALKLSGFVAARAVPAAAMMVFVGLMVRSLGPSTYAYLTLGLAIANSSATFCSGWLAQGLLRFLPGRPVRGRSTRQAVNTSILISLVATILAGALGVLLLEPAAVARSLFPSIYCLAVAMMLQNVQLAKLMVSGRSAVYAASEVARSLLLVALAAGFVMVDRISLVAAVWISVANYAVGAVVLWFFLRGRQRSGYDSGGGSRASILKWGWIARFWRFGSPMSVWLGVMVSLPIIDRAILIARAGAPVAGAYSASYDLFYRAGSFLFAPVLMVFHPIVMAEANTGHVDRAHRRVRRALAIALVSSILASALLASGAGAVGGVLGMDSAQLPYSLAFLLALGGCLWQTGLFAQKLLEIQQRTDVLLVCLIIGVACQAAAVALLAPGFGAMGAAVAGIVGATVYSLSSYIWGHRLMRQGMAWTK
jgi:O-antigen/teichoic acid export membrane protein